MLCQICGQDNPPEASFCANCGAVLVAAVEPTAPVAPEVAVKYAGFWTRLGASIIDGIIIWFIPSVLSRLLLSNIYGYGFSILPSFLSIFWFPVSWLYYWLFTGLKGQTPGKMAVGIKVVNVQGNIPGLGIAAMREVLGKTVSAIILYIGFLWIIWDKQKRGWHDIMANTRVVKVVKAEP